MAFTISGFLTPPDVASQVLMAIPLLALYELSIVLARIREKRKRLKKEEKRSEGTIDEEAMQDLMERIF